MEWTFLVLLFLGWLWILDYSTQYTQTSFAKSINGTVVTDMVRSFAFTSAWRTLPIFLSIFSILKMVTKYFIDSMMPRKKIDHVMFLTLANTQTYIHSALYYIHRAMKTQRKTYFFILTLNHNWYQRLTASHNGGGKKFIPLRLI